MRNRLTPRTGLSRFWELLTRDLWDFFRANLVLLAGLCPSTLLIVWGIWGHSLLAAMLGGILSGAVGGPLLCGLCGTILFALEDRAGFWSLQYKSILKRCWKNALLPGVISGAAAALWLFEAAVLVQQGPIPPMAAFLMLEVLFFLAGLLNYVFPQIAAGSVPVQNIYSGSIALFLRFLPRSLGAAAVQTTYWTGFLLLLPRSVPLLIVTGFWFPTLISLMLLQGPLSSCGEADA